MSSSYKEGDLIQFIRYNNSTLHIPKGSGFAVATVRNDKSINNIEGKVGLIVYVSRNQLLQVTGYQFLLEGKQVFCKSIVAEKHFRLVGSQNNESRRSGKVQDE